MDFIDHAEQGDVSVLIDTWWNVNLGNGTQIGTTIGF